MTRMVMCRKYKQELPGLDRPPYPGPKGQEVFNEVSRKAWDEWQKHQTMLINERRLNMMDPEDRRFIQQEMDKFLAGEEYAQADGYVPPSE
ncbi:MULTISPECIES: oxidative damage protection protein [Pseudomonadaceae]|jgi:Fe-S cluster biosynthesis and repair protein YggX|uniref:Iron transporter n=3 Tax=Pseudomonadaceae TaxID=135621 RepID=A0ACD6B3M4_9PSED|nr:MULTISPECIES: oxidative damage protection protein [Pseudomonadaceae]MAB43519.1 oxidative damage protection protein [Pseudomonadales bacterium]MAP30353.1 oxidative damage protection protein [Pseudomonas sp.]MED5493769.1 oxidative damage protection protein [Pseudomonadota bacterium]MAC99017.1 oxidative damage protection protein [Pseudomonadales bacterium]MAG67029.1 oxidative damage protection protein [Pseudomonadales bacterium]|tara:strand:- start:7068 stop:7340 length:273 start_codon:yes stop_codon:yes gene_type:complete